jgi:hypothetical protein
MTAATEAVDYATVDDLEAVGRYLTTHKGRYPGED